MRFFYKKKKKFELGSTSKVDFFFSKFNSEKSIFIFESLFQALFLISTNKIRKKLDVYILISNNSFFIPFEKILSNYSDVTWKNNCRSLGLTLKFLILLSVSTILK